MENKDDHPHGNGNGIHHDENIVIVGGGIGGLACAVALHKVGLKAVVLEQANTLRSGGISITLWANAFRVLDVLGVGEKFRTIWKIMNASAKPLGKLVLAECEGGPHDVRAVERQVLLETFAGELPEGTIRFNSRVTGIKQSERQTGLTEVELQDGTVYSAKVIIGFDGQKSVVGSWMGLENAQAVGQVAIRGMAMIPNGHKLEPNVNYFLGKGTSSAFLPVNTTKAYWFIIKNQSETGFGDTPPEQVKEEALQFSKTFQSPDLHFLINNTSVENLWKGSIRHRLNKTTDHLVKGNVTVAGDACHPTAPYMGQGGGMALEDAIILTQKLYHALREAPDTAGSQGAEVAGEADEERIHQALVEFQHERYSRTYSITLKSHQIGQANNSGWAVMDFYRDWFLVKKSLNKETFMLPAQFYVEELPGNSIVSSVKNTLY
ncbi:monooxygenase 2 isoform X2 [Physcomitrium patens]|uniref:FAD-binding domain-containing protein n=1 Tax=Physcomitrium patens TaxID=3218 RepID=A0A7I4D4P8_PHYPA|nr:monooxygenase 2-like isoform X2 [Physcomitrium patens]|eukprot:XP_024402826.1 monooxygenase 2-like isoform X2 [Physcomitrella patens]